MLVDNTKELFLEDETFGSARENFNIVLQKLFKSMIDSESSEGSITLKVDVDMEKEYIPNNDPDIKGETRLVHLPRFTHKVTSTITVKEERKGIQNPNMELVWDEESKSYKLQYISNTDQRTIFDKDAAWNQNGENVEERQKAIETGPNKKYLDVKQIEGPVADEGALPGEVSEPEEDAIVEDYEVEESAENPDDSCDVSDDGYNIPDEGYEYEDPNDE